jgi:hypothetical protein
MNGPSYPDHPRLLLTRIKLCSGLRCYLFGELDWHRNLVHQAKTGGAGLLDQGDLTQRAEVERDRAACIEAKGATHVDLRVNFDKEDRFAEEKDLLDNFPQAYIPDGCNEGPAR